MTNETRRGGDMSGNAIFSTLLVPIDFSEPSLTALEWAARLISGDDPEMILLHVIDEGFIASLITHGFGEREEVVDRLRFDAQRRLEKLKAEAGDEVNVDILICEGVPFAQIVQKAADFAVDAVVMSKVGSRRQFETLLFGSTAEKVARGCRHPVVVLPSNEK